MIRKLWRGLIRDPLREAGICAAGLDIVRRIVLSGGGGLVFLCLHPLVVIACIVLRVQPVAVLQT